MSLLPPRSTPLTQPPELPASEGDSGQQVSAASAPLRPRGRGSQERDPRRWGRRARGALTSIGFHAAFLAVLSVWALPHLREPAEARSAHLETSWTHAVRSEARVELTPAPAVSEPALLPEVDEEWEPAWEPPSAEPRPKSRISDPTKPGLNAARSFRTFTPRPKAAPKKRPAPRPVAKKRPRRPAPAVPRKAESRVARRSPIARQRQATLVVPKVKEQPRVRLPSHCRRRGHKGKARLLLEVDARGRVLSSEVATSAGCERLDKAAREAGLRYRFRPGTRDGRPSTWLVFVEIQFGTSG